MDVIGAKGRGLHVWLLGRFAVERDGEAIASEKWRRRRPTDVLKILALSADHALHREELIDRIWPDKALDSGANNLHRALHDLRRIIGEDSVTLDKGVVRLAGHAWVDVAAFEQAILRGDIASLSRAVELYAGDLCPDDPYAELLDSRRESLRQQLVDAAFKLARHCEQAGEDDRVIDVLRRLLSVDPVQEVAHRMLMQALVAAGRRHDALRQFATCVKVLREKLDVGPSAETLQLRETITRGAPVAERSETTPPGPARQRTGAVAEPTAGALAVARSARRPPARSSEEMARRLLGTDAPAMLRGREDELATVGRFVDSGAGVLVLSGEAGVGKSRLALQVAKLAEDKYGSPLLAGAGYDMQSPAPYMPFIQAFTDYLPTAGLTAEDVPFLSFTRNPDASMQENKLRLFQLAEQSVDLVRQARAGGGEDGGEGPPVALVLEDIHLFDESSLGVVHYLARATPAQRLLLVLTCRVGETRVGSAVQSLLSSLQRERLSTRLALERLDKAHTRAQIADLIGREPSAALVDTTYALTSGNAFYTEEVVRSLGDGGADAAAAPEISSELSEVVRDRVARLGGDAERLLVAADCVTI